MAKLNLDCWEVILDHLEPETRALYTCLFVSKMFFYLSTKVLYRRPLHLSDNQDEFSPFSVYRLANLMDLCSGFTTPIVAKPAMTGSKRNSKQLSFRSKSTKNEPLKVSESSSRDYFGENLSVKVETEVQVDQPISTLPTTINYFQLVQEYPRWVVFREREKTRWQEFLNCFAETIPILQIPVVEIDTILPLASRFRALHTMTILPPPHASTTPLLKRTFGTENMVKIVDFVLAHNRYFPGQLKELQQSESWFDWKEYILIQEALGGITSQKMTLKPLPSDQNLSQMNVSRLKSLSFYCPRENQASGKPTAEFLKTCTKLESLEMNWPSTVKLDWSYLLKGDEWEENRNVVGGVGGLFVEETKEGNGFGVFKIKTGYSNSSISLGDRSLQQLEQPEPAIKLRQLTVWNNSFLAVEAMEVFKDSLESIKLSLQNEDVHYPRILDWKCLFLMSKLKSIELGQYSLVIENLSCCPVLETLKMEGNDLFSERSPLNITWSTIPITLRKLYLSRLEVEGLDILMLRPLRNLEFLHLQCRHRTQSTRLPVSKLVDMSTGWYFPNLKHVVLYGKFALQFQGQILWIAPRLEYLRFNLWAREQMGMLDTNTFLFPPSELDFKRAAPGIDGFTRLVPLIRVSTARFPSLKSLGLQSFQVSNSTVEEFADLFFGPQPQSATIFDARTNVNDHERKNVEGIGFPDGYNKHSGIPNRFLFPNLEQLEFHFDEQQLFYYFPHCVSKAMRWMPKLERIWYPGSIRYWEYPWLKDLKQNLLGYHNIDYRNRPMATKLSTTTTTTTSSRFWKKQVWSGKAECVIQFDYPCQGWCRLDEVNVNIVNRTKRGTLHFFDHAFRAM